MQLIDRDALIAKAYIMQEPNGFIHSVVTERQIVAAPTIDAVPVVRCKDCKHFVQGEPYDPCECMKWTVKWGVAYTQPDDFCSYGERRSE